MRLSKAFWQTYKETPADAEIPSHQLMIRAGLIHKTGAGLYSYLPFGLKAIQKAERIVREELNRAGCSELLMSVVTPGELWKESGRWDKMTEMLKFKDKSGRDVCLSPTNEEAIADIFRKTVKSYKQLPTSLYQINTKFRDEIRPRFGLMRGREFTMKDAYTFHIDKACLDEGYENLKKAYSRIFERMGLNFFIVEADAGAMADSSAQTHEFQVIAENGEDVILFNQEAGYGSNVEKAKTKRANLEFDTSKPAQEEVATPGMSTIEDVCNFLKVEKHTSIKSLVYYADFFEEDKEGEFVLVQLLGDDDLNELKLTNYLGASELRPAHEDEIKSLGLVKGYIGAFNLKEEIKVLIDTEINLDGAYTVGGQKEDLHIKNFVPSRDIKEFESVDLRLAKKGDLTEDGKYTVDEARGIEVGHIFQLGDMYTKAMGITVLDQNGKTIPPLMGCYGIGITRTVAAAIEQSHDEKGIVWPVALAPADIYFASLAKSDELKALADEVYEELQESGLDIVFDDRKAGPGFKFKDADLLGLPLRVVLGEKTYAENKELEVVVRKTGESFKVQRQDLVVKLKELMAAM
ncbi:MAG: prolyl-tRNA synthetase [Bacteriovoracaceae bacterium]|jgi:prolyl-tRNA synthetase